MAACAAQASEENILKTVELLLSRNVDPNLTCRYKKKSVNTVLCNITVETTFLGLVVCT